MINVNHITGVNTFNLDQGTNEWRESRAGVVTASKASLLRSKWITPKMPDDVEIIATEKRGVNIVTYDGNSFEGTKANCEKWVREKLVKTMPEGLKAYMLELIAQIVTGIVPDNINFKQAEWGHLNEPLARDAYEARNMCVITECGLVYKDESLRCAISPDGLEMHDMEGLEIKNPFTSQVHLNTVLFDEINSDYLDQCQFSMWVTGWKVWNFCSYDHRMRGESTNRLYTKPIERDEEIMKEFDILVPAFIAEMDKHLTKLGFAFGDQWK